MPALNPAAPHALPSFIAEPGQADGLFVFAAWFLVVTVLLVGVFFLRIHTLPERMAHKSEKLQFEIVAVLGLLALFTHVHAFWVAGLLLAMVDLPDFGSPLRRIARGVEALAGIQPDARVLEEEEGTPRRGGHAAAEGAGHAPALHASPVAPLAAADLPAQRS